MKSTKTMRMTKTKRANLVNEWAAAEKTDQYTEQKCAFTTTQQTAAAGAELLEQAGVSNEEIHLLAHVRLLEEVEAGTQQLLEQYSWRQVRATGASPSRPRTPS